MMNCLYYLKECLRDMLFICRFSERLQIHHSLLPLVFFVYKRDDLIRYRAMVVTYVLANDMSMAFIYRIPGMRKSLSWTYVQGLSSKSVPHNFDRVSREFIWILNE